MIASMTGFGRGTATAEGVTATVEIRSVNKRHFDLSLRAPDLLAPRERAIETQIKNRFDRGRFKVNVRLDAEDADTPAVRVDTAAAVHYKQVLERLRAAAQLQEPIRLEHLLHFSGVFTTEEPDDEDPDARLAAVWPAVEAALADAIDALDAMRREEGAALHDDLQDRLNAMSDHLAVIQERAPQRVEEHQERLRTRLAELLDDDRLDRDRLETEIAIIADKLDINEECVRLRSHVDQFETALESAEPVGRKLKFLVQEMHREANTIGAKANDDVVSRHAVGIKEEIEKLREQINNVE
ncbi:YicC/YloC family endoribonuclease [Salisaeta longa]|uniref:YicC/YloC family endoribonuclease n=1 Tax=Salisaeta longa TaxID=503170 RepID=UPI0003B71750|nr:YicC/YloC family endoribonuclease [Salisaeta longa]